MCMNYTSITWVENVQIANYDIMHDYILSSQETKKNDLHQIQFCQENIATYNYTIYMELSHTTEKILQLTIIPLIKEAKLIKKLQDSMLKEKKLQLQMYILHQMQELKK